MMDYDKDVNINEGIVLLDFYATWCGPCSTQKRILESYNLSKLVKIDVDKFEEISKYYGVMSIPTLILLNDGVLVKKWVGVTQINAIQEALKTL